MIEDEIPSALDGERLDRIVSLMTACSRSDATALVAAGGAIVDDVITTSGKLRLRVGQVVRVDETYLPVEQRPEADATVEFTVVHADDQVIVVDKPAGLVVHPGAGNPTGTLVNGLLGQFPEIATVGEMHRPGIVHRLDIGTSGLLVVARTPAAYVALVDALASHDVGRTYRAMVWGTPPNPSGVVDAPIGRDHRDPMRMAVVVDGKSARTHYRVLTSYSHPVQVCALECRLETGRTHQIRVHLSAIGHPVVGDGTYGGNRDGLPSPRPFLHAAALSFVHPTSLETMSFESALPTDLATIEATLEI